METEPAECRVIAVPGGLAQAGVAYPLPGSVELRIRSVTFTLTTAAGGGSRLAFVSLVDGSGATVFTVAAPGLQAGGETVAYSFGEGVTPFGTAALGTMGGPFVGGRLPPNLVLLVSAVNTDATDALAGIRLLAEQVPVTVGS